MTQENRSLSKIQRDQSRSGFVSLCHGNANLSLAWASDEFKSGFYRFEEMLRIPGVADKTEPEQIGLRFDVITSRIRLMAAAA
jgi:hypothetical protein